MTPRERGSQAEEWLKAQLEARGFHCLNVNYCARIGELDLVMRRERMLLVVEVKYRRRCMCQGAMLERILPPSKQRKLRLTLGRWLQRHNAHALHPRIDLALVSGPPFHICRWVEHAVEGV